MQIKSVDHLVLTTSSLEKCLDFYGRGLGLECRQTTGRWAVHFGRMKINIHVRPGEFQPAAARPLPGALDLCFGVDGALVEALAAVDAPGWPVELGIVERHGARGAMRCFSVRDPDGNLIEIASYEEKI